MGRKPPASGAAAPRQSVPRAAWALEHRSDGRAGALDAPRRLQIGRRQAAVALKCAVEFSGEPRAVVLHQRKLFLHVETHALLAKPAFDRRLQEIEGGAQSLQGRLEKFSAHGVTVTCASMFTLQLNAASTRGRRLPQMIMF